MVLLVDESPVAVRESVPVRQPRKLPLLENMTRWVVLPAVVDPQKNSGLSLQSVLLARH